MVIEFLKIVRSEDQYCRKYDVVIELKMLNSVYRIFPYIDQLV